MDLASHQAPGGKRGVAQDVDMGKGRDCLVNCACSDLLHGPFPHWILLSSLTLYLLLSDWLLPMFFVTVATLYPFNMHCSLTLYPLPITH